MSVNTARTTLSGQYAEGSTMNLLIIITDVDGVTPLGNAALVLTALTLTLFESLTDAIINTCNKRSILNANGGLVYNTLQTDPNGNQYNILVQLSIDDMKCLGPNKNEGHVALIEWTWGTNPVKGGKHEIAFSVANFTKVS